MLQIISTIGIWIGKVIDGTMKRLDESYQFSSDTNCATFSSLTFKILNFSAPQICHLEIVDSNVFHDFLTGLTLCAKKCLQNYDELYKDTISLFLLLTGFHDSW